MSLEARWPQLRAAWRGGADGPLTRDERRRIVAGIQRLSSGLTRDRELVGARYLDDPQLLGAYLMFYWPRSYAQASSIFGELGALGRVLDVGAGPLPLSWAAIDRGAADVLAIDRARAALELGKRIGDPAPSTQPWDATRDALPEGAFDTIVMGHVLNELGALDRRVALVEALLGRLAPHGRVVLIEPALRDTSRDLLRLRDRLAPTTRIVAPCLHQLPCPALVKESDWCHAERAWTVPAELAQLADEARLHADHLKMSYVVLARDAVIPVDDALFRIVSEPLPQKGKMVFYGCGPGGRHPLVLADKSRAGNEVFADLSRGDIVRVDVEPRGDGLRIASVTRYKRAGEP